MIIDIYSYVIIKRMSVEMGYQATNYANNELIEHPLTYVGS